MLLISILKKQNNNKRNNLFIDAGLNMFGKKIKEELGSEITLTNNKIKDIMNKLSL